MSYCTTKGKDKVVFVTKEDHTKTPSAISLPEDTDDDHPGIVLRSGKINWACPCVATMVTGPCGLEFREAFTCYHDSKADPKGSDCRDPFNMMHECFSKYPSLYYNRSRTNRTDDDDDFDVEDPTPKELSAKDASGLSAKEMTSGAKEKAAEPEKPAPN